MFQRCILLPSSLPWCWRQYAPLKRRSTPTRLHGTTSQKDLIFILTAVRTWNLTYKTIILYQILCGILFLENTSMVIVQPLCLDQLLSLSSLLSSWYWGSFLGGEAWLERDSDHSPHLVPRSRMNKSYTSFSPCCLHGGSKTAFTDHWGYVCKCSIRMEAFK
jgi:hypothetical protein